MVGTGIQDALEDKSEEECLKNAFLSWPCDLFDKNDKQNKSFFTAWLAIRQFISMRENGYLDGYKLVWYQGKPANELSFSISLPDGFIYRGFVDAVLQHETTGEVVVLECKTSSATNINPAQYKNSAQAIGYSIVLDAIFPALSSYKVIYLVYQSKSEEYIQLPFEKSYHSRALWIQELLLDIEQIKMYEAHETYPMHGESCYSYFRECEYFRTCTLSTKHLTTKLSSEQEDRMEKELEKFQVRVTMEDLILSQLAKEEIPAVITADTNGDYIL